MRISDWSSDVCSSDLKVLVGIDLDVPAGTMVGFVGPNGSGKTTLLNIISGFVESDSGTVRLGDVDITGTPTHKVAALGLADRKSVGKGQSVSVRVDLGGRRIIKKTKTNTEKQT